MSAQSLAAGIDALRLRWLVALVAVAAVLLYARTISFEFVTYDDYDLVYQNEPFLAQPSNILRAFGTNAFTTHRADGVYYRPVLLAGYVVEYQLWKLNPAGYHAVNAALHAATCALVLLLLLRLGMPRLPSILGALLFAAHPVQTEAVAWIAGRNDVLLALFIVASALAFHEFRRSPDSKRGLWFGMSLLTYALALFTKESGVFAILLFPVVAMVDRNRTPWKTVVSLSFLLATGAYLIARHAAVGASIGTENLYADNPFWNRLLMAPAMFAEYVRYLLAPTPLSVVHPLGDAFWIKSGWNAVAFLVVLIIAALAIAGYRKDRLVFVGAGWLIVTVLPALNVIPIAVPILEHRLYLPMVGVVLLGGVFLQRIAVRSLSLAMATGTILIIVCAVASFGRMKVWQNSESLWLDAIAVSPASATPRFNLAGWYYEAGRFEDALRQIQEYVRLRPDDPMGLSKLRQTYYAAGRYLEAASVTRTLLARAPRNPDRYAEAAELFMEAQAPDSAIAVYRQGIEAIPSAYSLHDMLGRLFVRLDADSLAMTEYEAAIRLNPNYATAYFDLAALHASSGRNAAAIALLERGISFGPVPHDVLQLLHQLYLDTGQPSKAESLRQRYSQ